MDVDRNAINVHILCAPALHLWETVAWQPGPVPQRARASSGRLGCRLSRGQRGLRQNQTYPVADPSHEQVQPIPNLEIVALQNVVGQVRRVLRPSPMGRVMEIRASLATVGMRCPLGGGRQADACGPHGAAEEGGEPAAGLPLVAVSCRPLAAVGASPYSATSGLQTVAAGLSRDRVMARALYETNCRRHSSALVDPGVKSVISH